MAAQRHDAQERNRRKIEMIAQKNLANGTPEHSRCQNLQAMAEHSRIGIVGLGYVGLPLPLQSAGSGCRVQDFDRQGATQIAI
jgi:hypothetical protein